MFLEISLPQPTPSPLLHSKPHTFANIERRSLLLLVHCGVRVCGQVPLSHICPQSLWPFLPVLDTTGVTGYVRAPPFTWAPPTVPRRTPTSPTSCFYPEGFLLTLGSETMQGHSGSLPCATQRGRGMDAQRDELITIGRGQPFLS